MRASIINVIAAIIMIHGMGVIGHPVDAVTWFAAGAWVIFAEWTHRVLDRSKP